MTREFTTNSAEETIALGRELAPLLTPPKLVVLRGDLGAGKTTFVQGAAALPLLRQFRPRGLRQHDDAVPVPLAGPVRRPAAGGMLAAGKTMHDAAVRAFRTAV